MEDDGLVLNGLILVFSRTEIICLSSSLAEIFRGEICGCFGLARSIHARIEFSAGSLFCLDMDVSPGVGMV